MAKETTKAALRGFNSAATKQRPTIYTTSGRMLVASLNRTRKNSQQPSALCSGGIKMQRDAMSTYQQAAK
jgi:hypothetical protein